MRSILLNRAGRPEYRSFLVGALTALALVATVVIPSRLVTAQARQTPPDHITLRSPDGRSEVVIAVSDSGFLRITLAPTGSSRHVRLPSSLSLRLVRWPHATLELRDDREELVASLGGPRFRRIER